MRSQSSAQHPCRISPRETLYRSSRDFFLSLLGKDPSLSDLVRDLNILQRDVDRCKNASPRWDNLGRKLRTFLGEIGCTQLHYDVQENLASLRRFNAERLAIVGDLHTTIQQLLEKNRQQQKAITALMFRHALENLPDPKKHRLDPKGKALRATNSCTNFWATSIARTTDQGNPQGHLMKKLSAARQKGVVSRRRRPVRQIEQRDTPLSR